MVLWLVCDRRCRRAALPAIAVIALVGAALIPLVLAQGGHNTQWIGGWPLSQRLEAIPQYYLTGASGAALGHRVELLVALPLLAGLGFGGWRMFERGRAGARRAAPTEGERASLADAHERRGLLVALSIAAPAVLIPIVLAALGADYLAPRNLIGAMIPVTAAVAVVVVWPGTGRIGIALAAAIAVAFLAISLDVEVSPSIQRSNWRDLAKALHGGQRERVITTPELGSAPLQYYLPQLGLHSLQRDRSVLVSEIDETGVREAAAELYEPLRASAADPPAPGFHLLARVEVDGVAVYRFISSVPRTVSEATLRPRVRTLAGSGAKLLVPAGSRESPRGSGH
jgi:hypothetical protein